MSAYDAIAGICELTSAVGNITRSGSKQMSEWQPIETAPIREFDAEKWYMPHSVQILLWDGYKAFVGSYNYTQKGKGRWHAGGRIHEGCTHWMPIPPPPDCPAARDGV